MGKKQADWAGFYMVGGEWAEMDKFLPPILMREIAGGPWVSPIRS